MVAHTHFYVVNVVQSWLSNSPQVGGNICAKSPLFALPYARPGGGGWVRIAVDRCITNTHL